MPSSLIDSAVFRDIFSTEAMRRVFSDENRVQKWFDYEAALALSQAELGIVPQAAADEIARKAKVGNDPHYLVQALSEVEPGEEVVLEMKKAGVKNYIEVTRASGEVERADVEEDEPRI